MTVKLGVIMDPINAIHYKKDSTMAMLWEAQKRGWLIYYMEQKDVFMKNGDVYANVRVLQVYKDPDSWYEFKNQECIALEKLNVILMRKDPPVDLEYIYTTYLLEFVEHRGVLVVNKPQSLRDANEKLFTTWFSTCCPLTLVTSNIQLLRDFLTEQQDIICKPLNAMGGASIFRLQFPDENASVVFEMLTHYGKSAIVAQRYIAEVKHGDKRILLINGEPIPYALARIPAPGELRGNLAAGGHGIAQPLTGQDHKICQQVGPVLRQKGLFFVGLDVIGDFLTEINVTSPTCIRELDEQCELNIAETFMNFIEHSLRLS